MKKALTISTYLEAVFNAIGVVVGVLLGKLLVISNHGLMSVRLCIIMLSATMHTNLAATLTAMIWSDSLAMHLP